MDKATLWAEENIITKAIDEQQKNLHNFIKRNFEISKQQIADLKKEIRELKQIIEHAENVLEDRLASAEEKYREPYTGNVDYQLDPAFIEDKLNGLKNRSRRNNLRIDCNNEKPNETWKDCKKELIHF